MGGLRGVWFDGLTRNAGGGRMVECCWVPAGDAGMWFDSGLRRTPARLTMNGKGMGLGGREAGDGRGLRCVQSVG